MDNLLQNKLFLQYLSGAGSALQAGQPISTGIDPVTQQTIGAQSKHELQTKYMKMLQEMLGGLPVGGKISGDKDNLSIKIPTSSLSTPTELAQEGSQLPGGSGVDWSKPESQGQLSAFLRGGTVNPYASPPDVTAADLAGLTAADVSQALSGAMGVEGLRSDIAYKKSLMEESRARVKVMQTPKDERTAAIMNFEYAQSIEGGSYSGSFEDWEKEAKTAHQKHYDQAVAEGYKGNFHDWLRDITALGGGLSLEEKITEKEAFADVKARKDFVDDLAKYVDDFTGSSEMRQKVSRAEADVEGSGTVTKRLETAKHIEKGIIAKGGKIIGRPRMEGRVRIWEVKWRDGAVSEVRFPF